MQAAPNPSVISNLAFPYIGESMPTRAQKSTQQRHIDCKHAYTLGYAVGPLVGWVLGWAPLLWHHHDLHIPPAANTVHPGRLVPVT